MTQTFADPTRKVFINNLQSLQYYLDLDQRSGKSIISPNLYRNRHIEKVNKLIDMLPTGFQPRSLQAFYELTGLKILVEVHRDDYTLVWYDRHDRYPREDACLWNTDFIKGVSSHPEWLKPQEIPDLIIQFIYPIRDEFKEA